MLFHFAHSQLKLAYRAATQKQKADWKGRGDSQTDGVSRIEKYVWSEAQIRRITLTSYINLIQEALL